MLILYRSMFLPGLIYNCEAWSNMTKNDYETLKSQQLNYLQSNMELPKGAPIAALYLELGILPIRYEIEMRQILYLKKVLGKKPDDPVLLAYKEMLKFDSEDNWANNLLGLRKLYNLPLNDDNVKKMKTEDWKLLVKNTLKRDAFLQFFTEPKCARIIFRTRCRMIDLKVKFKKKYGMDLRCTAGWLICHFPPRKGERRPCQFLVA